MIGMLHPPFTLLEIHHALRDKSPMTSTGAPSDSSGIQIFAIGIPAIYCSMIAASGFLKEAIERN